VTLRKLVGVVPVIAALALAAPVATASAQSPAGAAIPCYPYPAFCGPNGQPWFQPSPLVAPLVPFGPGPVQLPGLFLPFH
jgi:hypothetical protein